MVFLTHVIISLLICQHHGEQFPVKYIRAVITRLNCNHETKSLQERPPGGMCKVVHWCEWPNQCLSVCVCANLCLVMCVLAYCDVWDFIKQPQQRHLLLSCRNNEVLDLLFRHWLIILSTLSLSPAAPPSPRSSSSSSGCEDGGKMRPPSPLLILLYITLSKSVKVVSKRGSGI